MLPTSPPGLCGAPAAQPGPRARAQRDALYVTLLRVVIDQHDDAPLFDVWYRLLDVPTWPEILRRYVLHKATAEGGVQERVKLVGSLLAVGSVSELHCDQHLTLLQFLCDALLETPVVRSLLDGMWSTEKTLTECLAANI